MIFENNLGEGETDMSMPNISPGTKMASPCFPQELTDSKEFRHERMVLYPESRLSGMAWRLVVCQTNDCLLGVAA